MEDLYTLYLDHYADYYYRDENFMPGTKLERAAAMALAQFHRISKRDPLDFYHFGLEWEKLRNTAPVK